MRRNAIVLAGMLGLAGCSSVDQVPLVYVSTAKVGLNVESGSAETPGASIMIGVDLTDAAYVPVAVTRRCDQTTMERITDCIDEEIAIWRVLGTSTDFTEDMRANLLELSSRADGLKGELQTAERAYFDAVENERQVRSDLVSAQAAGQVVEE